MIFESFAVGGSVAATPFSETACLHSRDSHARKDHLLSSVDCGITLVFRLYQRVRGGSSIEQTSETKQTQITMHVDIADALKLARKDFCKLISVSVDNIDTTNGRWRSQVVGYIDSITDRTDIGCSNALRGVVVGDFGGCSGLWLDIVGDGLFLNAIH